MGRPRQTGNSTVTDVTFIREVWWQIKWCNNNNIIIMLYYRLAEHINKYMSVVQYIVSTLSTKVGIQLLTMSVATMRRAHTATVSNENEFVRSTLHLKPVQL